MKPVTAYDLVRFCLAGVLLLAAGLKGYQLATEPVLGTGLLDSRWFLIVVVEFELFFGLWLLANFWPEWTRRTAIACFAVFAAVSLYKALSGAASCSCFGRVTVNPWYRFAVDVAAVLALFWWRPMKIRSSTPVLWPSPVLRTTVITLTWLSVGVPVAIVASRLAVVLPAAYQRSASGTLATSPPRASPISVRPHPQRCLHIPEKDLLKIRDQVQPLDEGMTTSLYLHVLRVFGQDSKYHRGKLVSSGETLRLFADDEFSKKVLGTALMVQTRWGVRTTPKRNHGTNESHRDYCLAILSEQSLPISFSIAVKGRLFTFSDFLADSIANFHLGQEEIEWTAMTYAMWLPPAHKWTNKFGEIFTFDQLAVELMHRPLDNAVCAGCHLVQSMIVLSRVDREASCILSPEVRNKLLTRLREIVYEVEARCSFRKFLAS